MHQPVTHDIRITPLNPAPVFRWAVSMLPTAAYFANRCGGGAHRVLL